MKRYFRLAIITNLLTASYENILLLMKKLRKFSGNFNTTLTKIPATFVLYKRLYNKTGNISLRPSGHFYDQV
jgi:hypothetical protein